MERVLPSSSASSTSRSRRSSPVRAPTSSKTESASVGSSELLAVGDPPQAERRSTAAEPKPINVDRRDMGSPGREWTGSGGREPASGGGAVQLSVVKATEGPNGLTIVDL